MRRSSRTDWRTRAFYGPWERPLTCVGCGDASKQESILCAQINKVPEELLAKLSAHDDLDPSDLLGRLRRDGGVLMQVEEPRGAGVLRRLLGGSR